MNLHAPDILMGRILDIIVNLPPAVQKFVEENVQFGMAWNSMIPTKGFKKKYAIFLRKDCSEFTVAHEIAHAYLGHHGNEPWEEDANQEKEADKLAREWLKPAPTQ